MCNKDTLRCAHEYEKDHLDILESVTYLHINANTIIEETTPIHHARNIQQRTTTLVQVHTHTKYTKKQKQLAAGQQVKQNISQ